MIFTLLGNKLEKMEKLGSGVLLREVHEAAEELQMMIDKKSYLLINAESWASRRMPKQFDSPDQFQELRDNENQNLVISSLSEVALHLKLGTMILRTAAFILSFLF